MLLEAMRALAPIVQFPLRAGAEQGAWQLVFDPPMALDGFKDDVGKDETATPRSRRRAARFLSISRQQQVRALSLFAGPLWNCSKKLIGKMLPQCRIR